MYAMHVARASLPQGDELVNNTVSVHVLDQSRAEVTKKGKNAGKKGNAGAVLFRGHTDSNDHESGAVVSRTVLLKTGEGHAHSVGFWPCGCGNDTLSAGCDYCTMDTVGTYHNCTSAPTLC